MNKTLVTLALVGGMSGIAYADPAPDFTALVAQTKDAVVSIEVESKINAYPAAEGIPPDILERFFGIPGLESPFEQRPQQRKRIAQGQGSGFIIDADGYILTNAHVVDGADTVKVQLNNNKEYTAEVVGADKRTDVALVKIKGEHLPVAHLGDSDKVQVGDWVLAIGSPFGFTQTATQGIISAVARNLPSGDYVPFIQTDAAVNPGNSGGPLFNSKGEVIAINSQIYSRSGAFNGLAFSIPINMAKNIAKQLKDKGEVVRGWLGVQIQGLDQPLAESLGLDKPQGALVSEVFEDSPAEKAGLQSGDVILSYNGKSIKKSVDLPALVAGTPVGDNAKLEILRNGKEETLKVKIGNMNDADNLSALPAAYDGKHKGIYGMYLQNPDNSQREIPGFDGKGVVIANIAPDSAAENSGLQAGDVILSVAGKKVSNVKSAVAALRKAGNRKPILLLIYRGGNRLFLPLQP